MNNKFFKYLIITYTLIFAFNVANLNAMKKGKEHSTPPRITSPATLPAAPRQPRRPASESTTPPRSLATRASSQSPTEIIDILELFSKNPTTRAEPLQHYGDAYQITPGTGSLPLLGDLEEDEEEEGEDEDESENDDEEESKNSDVKSKFFARRKLFLEEEEAPAEDGSQSSPSPQRDTTRPSLFFPERTSTNLPLPPRSTTPTTSSSFSDRQEPCGKFFRKGGEESPSSSAQSTPLNKATHVFKTPETTFSERLHHTPSLPSTPETPSKYFTIEERRLATEKHLKTLIKTPNHPTASTDGSSAAPAAPHTESLEYPEDFDTSFSSRAQEHFSPEDLCQYLLSIEPINERLKACVRLLSQLRITNDRPEEIRKIYCRTGDDNQEGNDREINNYIKAILKSLSIINNTTLKKFYKGKFVILNLPIINWDHISTYQPTGGLHYCCQADAERIIPHRITNTLTDVCAGNHNTDKFSSFFPITMAPEDVINCIKKAFANQIALQGNTILGFDRTRNIYVEMYRRGLARVVSAFPIFHFMDLGEEQPATLEFLQDGHTITIANEQIMQIVSNALKDECSQEDKCPLKYKTKKYIIIDIASIVKKELIPRLESGFYVKIPREHPIYIESLAARSN